MKTENYILRRICLVFTILIALAGWQINAAEAADSTAAKKPRVIALLPVENMELLADCDGDKYVRQQLARLVHVPLNEVTKAVEYADGVKTQRELESLVNSARYVTKRNRPDYVAMMPELADRLGADLVIFLRVREAHEAIYHDWWGRRFIRALVELELLGFDRAAAERPQTELKKKNKLPAGVIRKSMTRQIHEEYMGHGLYELTEEALDALLAETDMRERVFPVRKYSQVLGDK